MHGCDASWWSSNRQEALLFRLISGRSCALRRPTRCATTRSHQAPRAQRKLHEIAARSLLGNAVVGTASTQDASSRRLEKGRSDRREAHRQNCSRRSVVRQGHRAAFAGVWLLVVLATLLIAAPAIAG